MASEYTKNVRRELWFYRIIDALIMSIPLIVFFFMALSNNEVPTANKFACVALCFVAIILALVRTFTEKNINCVVWIMLIGLYIAISKYLLPLIIVMAVTTAIDDFILQPTIAYYKAKLVASKVVDDRGQE